MVETQLQTDQKFMGPPMSKLRRGGAEIIEGRKIQWTGDVSFWNLPRGH
jgi:hypothetical protein